MGAFPIKVDVIFPETGLAHCPVPCLTSGNPCSSTQRTGLRTSSSCLLPQSLTFRMPWSSTLSRILPSFLAFTARLENHTHGIQNLLWGEFKLSNFLCSSGVMRPGWKRVHGRRVAIEGRKELIWSEMKTSVSQVVTLALLKNHRKDSGTWPLGEGGQVFLLKHCITEV